MHNVQLSETADTSKWELRCNCGVLGKSELPCTVVCLFFSSNYQIGQSTWLVVIQFAHEFLSGLSSVMEVKSLGATKTTELMHVLMHVVEVFMHTGLELHKPIQQCSKKQTEHIVSQRSCLPDSTTGEKHLLRSGGNKMYNTGVNDLMLAVVICT